MKKQISCIIIVLLGSFGVFGQERFEVDKIVYEKRSGVFEVDVVEYTSSKENASVYIPAVVKDASDNEYAVVSVKDNVFANRTLASVALGSSTTSGTMTVSSTAFDGATIQMIDVYCDLVMGDASKSCFASVSGIYSISVYSTVNTITTGLFAAAKMTYLYMYSAPSVFETGAFTDAEIGTIWCPTATPPAATYDVFGAQFLKNAKLQVSNKDQVAAYRAAEGWGEFKTIFDNSGTTDVLPDISGLPATLSMNAGEESQFQLPVVSQNGATVAGTTVAWSSSNEQIATIDQDGIIMAVKGGETIITATVSGTYSGTSATAVKARCVVTVTGEPVVNPDPDEPKEEILLTLSLPNGKIALLNAGEHDTPLRFIADEGCILHTVCLNGSDISAMVDTDGNYTLSKLSTSAEISVVYELGGTSTIDSPANKQIKIHASDGTIYIEGATEGETASLYDIQGRLILTSSDQQITTTHTGITILKIADRTFKLCL